MGEMRVMVLGVWGLIDTLRELWRWTTERRADVRRYREWTIPAHGKVEKAAAEEERVYDREQESE